MVSESDAGFRQRSSAGGSCEKLNAKFRFEPEEPTTDDGLGDSEPRRGRRYSSGVSDFDERPYVVNIQCSVPHPATQRTAARDYRIASGNTNVAVGLRRCWRTSPKDQCRAQRQ